MHEHFLQTKVQSIFNSVFLRDVAKLSFGSILGKSALLLAMPFLTRMYSPEHFGLLSAYLAVVTTFSIVACFRLDVAIPLSLDDDEAANLLVLCVTLVLGFAAVLCLGVLVFTLWFSGPFADFPLTDYAWLIPFGVLIAGLYSPLQLWSTRNRRFVEIAWTRVTQSLLGVSVMLIGGIFQFVPTGLLVGNVFTAGAGSLRLAFSAYRRDREKLRSVSLEKMRAALKNNIDFPKFATAEAFLNIAGIQLPLLIIAFYASETAGYLFLAMQIMFAPMKLVGGSLSQVFASRGPETMKNGTLRAFTLKVMINSAKYSIAPLLAMGLGFYFLAGPVFGDEWSVAGSIGIWMLPWAFIQFVASPVSTIIYMVGWQRRLLLVRLFTFALRVTAVVGALRFLPKEQVPAVYCMANFVVYLIMAVFFRAAASSKTLSDR